MTQPVPQARRRSARGVPKGKRACSLLTVGQHVVDCNYYLALAHQIFVYINVINLIIGRYLGPGALGHYSLAYPLTITPLLRANTVLM